MCAQNSKKDMNEVEQEFGEAKAASGGAKRAL